MSTVDNADTSGINLHVYPNPAMDRFQIATDKEFYLVRLLDLTGRIVKEWNPAAGQMIFNVTDMPAGIYMLQLTTGDGLLFKKLILQK